MKGESRMTLRTKRTVYVAGIIERPNNHVLIVLARGPEAVSRKWQFPRDRTLPNETPETAMRRVAREKLGLSVEIVVGQPPVLAKIDGVDVEVRFFFCGLEDGEVLPDHYAELAWIHKAHLLEYDFDVVSGPVVAWMLDTRT
jgi:ADP-ribose pyrophosphatase YjhB (NUDIX family)